MFPPGGVSSPSDEMWLKPSHSIPRILISLWDHTLVVFLCSIQGHFYSSFPSVSILYLVASNLWSNPSGSFQFPSKWFSFLVIIFGFVKTLPGHFFFSYFPPYPYFNRLISCFKRTEAHASILFFSHASNMWSLMCGSSSCRVWFSVFLFLVLGPCFLVYNVVLTTDPHPLKWFYLGELLRDLIWRWVSSERLFTHFCRGLQSASPGPP